MAKATPAIKRPPEADKKEVQWVELGQLRLDPRNPRLREGMETASQPELLAELAREYELQELGRSIADNGYFSEEPLVAIKDRGGKWTIVEGKSASCCASVARRPECRSQGATYSVARIDAESEEDR
jgi:hypothetical protein